MLKNGAARSSSKSGHKREENCRIAALAATLKMCFSVPAFCIAVLLCCEVYRIPAYIPIYLVLFYFVYLCAASPFLPILVESKDPFI